MQNSKGNIFLQNIKLLNSQENTEDITWTSSEASDYENIPNYDKTFTNHKRKRKRKRKMPKNLSNLKITLVDDYKDYKSRVNRSKGSEKSIPISPLCLQQPEASSPIVKPKYFGHQIEGELQQKSPILLPKYSSPKNSSKVSKKLFKAIENYEETDHRSNDRSTSPVLYVHNKTYNKREPNKCENYSNWKLNKCTEKLKSNNRTVIHDNEDDNVESNIEEHLQNVEKLDDSAEMLKIKDSEMRTKVISYFNSFFSSESASQHSIFDIQSPKLSPDAKSEEIEIIASITPVTSNNSSVESTKQGISRNVSPTNRSKKIRYKKDGLAFRLNTLLMKQKANISLWQHERDLARYTNFRMPKSERMVFLIQKVHFRYGTNLLEVTDVNKKDFLILINNNSLNNNTVMKDFIIYLYDPYNIIDFNDRYKLVINVCKFECVKLQT